MTTLTVNGFTWLVTGVGFGMVIVLLIVLIFILMGLGAIVSRITAPKAPKTVAKAAPAVQAPAASAQGKESDEMPVAAIAMALHLYFNGVHDEEPTQITIKNVERSYSPWNSKLYGMNNLHR